MARSVNLRFRLSSSNSKLQRRQTPAESFVKFAISLTNVAVFAGSFAFGTLLLLPDTLDDFDYIGDLLSIAFLLFASSIFIAISVQYLRLRRYIDSESLLPVMSVICQVHTVLIIAFLMAGFIVLNIVLITLKRKVVGIIGIIILGVVPVVRYAESTGVLGVPVPVESGSQVGE
jgi:hypothetical protein